VLKKVRQPLADLIIKGTAKAGSRVAVTIEQDEMKVAVRVE
jgi:hypothetical protein